MLRGEIGIIFDQIPFELDVQQLFKRLHLDPAGDFADEVQKLADEAMRVVKPKAMYEVVAINACGEESVTMNGIPFESRVLRASLAQVEQVFPFVATCGVELDRMEIAAEDLFGKFCRDTIKEMALNSSSFYLLDHLQKEYHLGGIATMSPGSGDAVVWPIEQQRPLFTLLGDVQRCIGVSLTDSFLMLPNKTISGVAYGSEDGFVTCQVCHRENCPGRRAPFDEQIWQTRNGMLEAH